jgi:hypothetical protein
MNLNTDSKSTIARRKNAGSNLPLDLESEPNSRQQTSRDDEEGATNFLSSKRFASAELATMVEVHLQMHFPRYAHSSVRNRPSLTTSPT